MTISLLKLYLRFTLWRNRKRRDPVTAAILGAALDSLNEKQMPLDMLRRRVLLTNLILGEAIVHVGKNDDGQNTYTSNREVAKDWAKVCSEVIGMLAATTVAPNQLNDAVKEMAVHGFRIGRMMSDSLADIRNFSLPTKKTSAKETKEAKSSQASQASPVSPQPVSEARATSAMIADLRSQAARTDDPNMKAALLSSAVQLSNGKLSEPS